ncbi:hypothetical protein [Mumia sp. DW29H23]|uniref:hypothetical protein n=1 Tax=Mumia sp. DW29H23 TaxID=3421241 RepID=UPI003D69154B
MTDIDFADLRAKAQAAPNTTAASIAARPKILLALLDRLERSEAAVARARAAAEVDVTRDRCAHAILAALDDGPHVLPDVGTVARALAERDVMFETYTEELQRSCVEAWLPEATTVLALFSEQPTVDAVKRDALDPVVDHINQRPEYVQALRNTRGDGDQADYWRWQGHAEARRQLAAKLGLPVPHESSDRIEREASR